MTAVTFSVYTVEGSTSVCKRVLDVLTWSQCKDGVAYWIITIDFDEEEASPQRDDIKRGLARIDASSDTMYCFVFHNDGENGPFSLLKTLWMHEGWFHH